MRHHFAGVGKKIPASGGGGRRGAGRALSVSPSSLRLFGRLSRLPLSLRRLSSLSVSFGRPCPPRLFPCGVRPPFYSLRRRPALGGAGDTSFLRRLRSLRSSSAPPSALRSFLRSYVPPPFLRSPCCVVSPSSLRLYGRLSRPPLSLRRLSSLSVSFGRPCPPRLFPCGVRPPFYSLRRRPALGGSGDTSFLRRLRSLRSASAPPSALRSFLRSYVPPTFRAPHVLQPAGAARRPLLQRAAGAARRPRRLRSTPHSLHPPLCGDLRLPLRAAASPPPFAFGVLPLSSGALCRPRWLQPPRPPPAPAPAGSLRRVCVPRGTWLFLQLFTFVIFTSVIIYDCDSLHS